MAPSTEREDEFPAKINFLLEGKSEIVDPPPLTSPSPKKNFMKEYEGNMKKYKGDMKQYMGNIKKNEGNIRNLKEIWGNKYGRLRRKCEEI